MAEKQYWEEIYQKMDEKLQAQCIRLGDKIPYIPRQGRYEDMREKSLSFWTNGFWAGILWQMYHGSQKNIYKETAKKNGEAMNQVFQQFTEFSHDIGFQFLHTAVADYRLTKDSTARERGLHAAGILAGRFNPAGNFIRAWNDNNGKGLGPNDENKAGWMIIDCLMNIPLLYWAGEELRDPRFAYIADQHAHTALKVLLRPDGSCNHIAILDPVTGELMDNPAGQGYASGSSWTRGQSWALYGFALAYLHTKKQEYLDAAKQSAHYFIANVSGTDYVSKVDFRSPAEPVYWDTTATACAACGLLQIAELVPEYEKALYYENGVKMLTALTQKHCDWETETDGILQNGTVMYWREEERHVPIIYGDYFLVEGVLRLLGKSFLIW